MKAKKTISVALAGALLASGFGCESLPGGKREQGAVIGGVGGAAAGALIAGNNNRLMGALLGGALGAGGGYLIGTQLSKSSNDRDDALKASERAQSNPVTVEQARTASTADVNRDGYVTLDEVVALHKAGLSDDQIISRLSATNMFFDLNSQQQDYLRNNGVSNRVITAMNTVNPELRRQAEARAAGGAVRAEPVGSAPVGGR